MTIGEHNISSAGGNNTGAIVAPTTTISPYTLSSFDNTGAAISSVLLKGDNYNEWSEEMWNALQSKRKTDFKDGSITKPANNSPDLDNWKTVNSMIVGWIRFSIEPTVKSTVTFIFDAHLFWEELKQRFYVRNKVRVHQIKAQLASCKQDGEAVITYYGRLCKLWEELKNFQASLVCSCGATMTEFVRERDEEKIHQFVMGLDDSRFGGLCTMLISMDPLPSLGVAYSKAIREEQRLSSARIREQQQEAVGFVARHESSSHVDSSFGSGSTQRSH